MSMIRAIEGASLADGPNVSQACLRLSLARSLVSYGQGLRRWSRWSLLAALSGFLFRRVLAPRGLLCYGHGVFLRCPSQALVDLGRRLSRPLGRERCPPAAGALDEPAGFRGFVIHYGRVLCCK
jgi:hypothetical protein